MRFFSLGIFSTAKFELFRDCCELQVKIIKIPRFFLYTLYSLHANIVWKKKHKSRIIEVSSIKSETSRYGSRICANLPKSATKP